MDTPECLPVFVSGKVLRSLTGCIVSSEIFVKSNSGFFGGQARENTHTEFEDLETDTIKTIQALESLPILQVRLQIIRESTMIKTVQRRIVSR